MMEKRNGDENAWYLTDDDTAIVYMCGVDWQHHTLEDPGGVVVYGSQEELSERHFTIESCGIVEIEMRVRRWVKPQNLGGRDDV